MHLSALFIVCDLDSQPQVVKHIEGLPWAEQQLEEPSKLIVTIEAKDEHEAGQRVRQLEQIEGVMAAQVTAFYASETE